MYTREQLEIILQKFNELGFSNLKKVAEGGEGIIFTPIFDEGYAIKLLKPKNSKRMKRYEQELKNVKQLNHPGIINAKYKCFSIVIDGNDVDQSFHYSIMPFYNRDLRAVINNNSSYEQLFEIIINIAEAIKYIHCKGIVHRDLKPENILISAEGTPIITDFGIAHFKDSNLTKDNDKLSNKNYQSPEQLKRGDSKRISFATDIFSFGLIINECFTKRIPHGVNYQLIRENYPFLFELDNLVTQMLASDPEIRINIHGVLTELHFILDNLKSETKKIRNRLLREYKNSEFINSNANIQLIIDKASKDIYFASKEYTINLKNKKFYLNYNSDIGYDCSYELNNIIISLKILDIVRDKFIYESSYANGPELYFLDPKDNKELYTRLENVMRLYHVRTITVNSNRIYGQIKKYFSALNTNHAVEVLEKIENKDTIKRVLEDIEDAPILWIKNYITSLGVESELLENLKINWNRTLLQNDNNIGPNLYTNKKYTPEVLSICKRFSKRFGSNYSCVNEKIRIIFEDYRKYLNFLNYATSSQFAKYKSDIKEFQTRIINNFVVIDLDVDYGVTVILNKIIGRYDKNQRERLL